MKRKLFSFLMFFLCTVLYAQTYSVTTKPQPQGVLLEESTGVRCQFCPEGHAIGERLKAILGDQLSIVSIHCGRFAAVNNPAKDYRVADGIAIAELLGSESANFPNGAVNRHNWNGDASYVFSRWDWITRAKEIYKRSAPVNLWAEAGYDSETRRLNIKVEGFFTADEVQPEQRLHVMLVQNHIIGTQSGASTSEYEHEHMLRDAISDARGDLIENCRPKTYFSRSYTYDVPELFGAIPVKAEDLELVIFVTGENSLHVQNVITVKPEYTEAFPLKAGIKLTPLGITDDYQFPYVPVVLTNRSNTVLTSARFSISLNGNSREEEWTGEIPAFGSREIQLPIQWDEALQERNSYSITLLGLNGEPVNTAVLSGFFDHKELILPETLVMKHYTTDDTENNTYTLYDLDGQTSQQFGPYENEHFYEETLQLKRGHRYCLEVGNRWGIGYMPLQNFLELCNAEGTPLAVRDRLTDFGFRIFFRVEGEMESPVETCNLTMHVVSDGFVRINDEVELRGDAVRTLTFNKGETVRITTEPMARYHLESFQVNGVEMVDEVDGYYTFQIMEDTEIIVGFDYFGGTGIDEISKHSCRLTAHDGQLDIEGLQPGQTVRIYTPAGTLVRQLTPRQERVSVALEPQQLYIVSIAGRHFKLFLH